MTHATNTHDNRHPSVKALADYVMIIYVERKIEPGLLRVFRYFAAISAIYFAILWLFNILNTGINESFKLTFWGNFIVYLGLFLYLSSSRLEKKLKFFYLPIALAVFTLSPIIGNIVYLLDPQQADIFTIVSESWLRMPILFVPVVLIAWQYNLKAVIAYIVVANGLELMVLLAIVGRVTPGNITIIGVPLLRAFAFGIVGQIVNTMANTQRMQTQKLIRANFSLNQYLNTLEELTASRERTRLASELHDTLAHTLSGLAINLEAIKTVVPPSETVAQEMLDHSLNITRSGLDETRRVLKSLRAGPLENYGLQKGLKDLVQDASLRGSIPVELDCPEQIPVLPLEVEQSIYRIAQESLENVLRHSNATAADVRLSVSSQEVSLTIHDNGNGFLPDSIQQGDRYGLKGLKERAASVGGTLDVQSFPGEGTTIRFVWERFS